MLLNPDESDGELGAGFFSSSCAILRREVAKILTHPMPRRMVDGLL